MLAGRKEDPIVAFGSVSGERAKRETKRKEKKSKDFFHSYLLIIVVGRNLTSLSRSIGLADDVVQGEGAGDLIVGAELRVPDAAVRIRAHTGERSEHVVGEESQRYEGNDSGSDNDHLTFFHNILLDWFETFSFCSPPLYHKLVNNLQVNYFVVNNTLAAFEYK